jgi:Undecaprenyl-phosphate glucose phosphotransferase
VIVALNTTFPVIGITNKVVVLAWILAMVLTSLARLIYRSGLGLARRRGMDGKRVLIVGAEPAGLLVRRQLQRAPWLGYSAVGFLSDHVKVGELVEGLPVLGRRRYLPEIVRQERIDEVFIALAGASYEEVLTLLGELDDRRVGIKIYPDAFQIITHNSVSVDELSGLPLVSLRRVPLDQGLNRAIKRVMDIIIAGIILILISPLMLLLALLIRLDSPGPVFFVQERVGLDGRPFKIIKFRSMRSDAEAHSRWTRPDDERRTKLGAIIRRFSLDELPQFINVIWGEMSVVGPRPEQPAFVEEFRERIPFYMHRHREKAGITGWAQVNGLRGDTSIEERTRYDLYYVENWSPLFDLKIILRTIVHVIRGAAY